MELDDFKKGKNRGNVTPNRMDEMISLFKSYQTAQRKKSVYWSGFLILLSVIYFSLMRNLAVSSKGGMLILGVGCILGALYIFLRYKPLQSSSFTLSTKDFLALAEDNLKYFKVIDWLIVIPLLLILGTGGGLVFVNSLLHHTDNLMLLIIIWCIFFPSLSVFGFLAGKKNWKRDYATLLDDLEQMKNQNNKETD